MRTMDLSPDELLTTTRAVRRRLDLSRPVEREVIEECVAIAQQAPTGSNRQNWHFVVVTDSSKRAALASLYRKGAEIYHSLPAAKNGERFDDPARNTTQARVVASALYLVEHIHEVPVHVIPCIEGRTDGLPTVAQAAQWCSIVPAAWSFMLAARARGLGTTFTSFHLFFEEDAAKVLGIPFEAVMQTALIPVAYTKGVRFKPGPREPVGTILHWDDW
ncbi:MAG: nitroreductase family protein [Candidatus Bathyarchaeia archaeon]